MKNKPTEMAPTDDQNFYDVMPPDQFPDLHIYMQRASCLSSDPPSTSIPPADALSFSSAEDPMQRLLTEVHAMSN